MRLRISIRGRVRPSVCPVLFSKDEKRPFRWRRNLSCTKRQSRTIEKWHQNVGPSVCPSIETKNKRKWTISGDKVVASFEPRGSCSLTLSYFLWFSFLSVAWPILYCWIISLPPLFSNFLSLFVFLFFLYSLFLLLFLLFFLSPLFVFLFSLPSLFPLSPFLFPLFVLLFFSLFSPWFSLFFYLFFLLLFVLLFFLSSLLTFLSVCPFSTFSFFVPSLRFHFSPFSFFFYSFFSFFFFCYFSLLPLFLLKSAPLSYTLLLRFIFFRTLSPLTHLLLPLFSLYYNLLSFSHSYCVQAQFKVKTSLYSSM